MIRCLAGWWAYLRGFNRELAGATLPPALPGNRLTLLIDGDQALPAILAAIEDAAHHIHMQAMIFVNDAAGRRIGAALMAAARRGVRVVMLLPDTHNDQPTAQLAARRRFRSWLDAGIELYEYATRMTHAKVVLIDDHWATLGSCNLNHRSFNHDLEANIVVDDPAFAAQLRQRLFQEDVKRSRPITRGRGWRPVDALLRWLEPLS